IKTLKPIADLRAIDKDESDAAFEARNLRGFGAVLKSAAKSKTVALIACHRSNTAYLAKAMGGVLQAIDYRVYSVVHEGGVLQITDKAIQALYKWHGENTKASMGQPYDGTEVSGFVTAEENEPPRDCGHCKW